MGKLLNKINKLVSSESGQGLIGAVMLIGIVLWVTISFVFEMKLQQHKSTMKNKNYFSIGQAFEQAAQTLRNTYAYRANCSPKGMWDISLQDNTSATALNPLITVQHGKFSGIVSVDAVSGTSGSSYSYGETLVSLSIDGDTSNPKFPRRIFKEQIVLLNTCAYADAVMRKIPVEDTKMSATCLDKSGGDDLTEYTGNYTSQNDPAYREANVSDLRLLNKIVIAGDLRPLGNSFQCQNPPLCPCNADVNQDGIIDEADLNYMEKLMRGYIHSFVPWN